MRRSIMVILLAAGAAGASPALTSPGQAAWAQAVSAKEVSAQALSAPALSAPELSAGEPARRATIGRPVADSAAANDSAADSAAVRSARAARQGSRLEAPLWTAGGIALATVAVMPLDASVAEAFRDPGPQGSGALRRGAAIFNGVGDPGVLVASLAMYGTGRATGRRQLTTVGAHATEAIVISGAATALVKLAAGRQRPNVETGDADDFALGGGFRAGRTSFPSGHTTAAFAFASAVTADLRAMRPDVARVAGPLLYAGAATVGAARIYSDRHWASDVVLGAGIGTLVGRTLVAHALANPDNWLDRQLRAVSVMPASGGGVALGAHYSFR